jgi:hypothetical protein
MIVFRAAGAVTFLDSDSGGGTITLPTPAGTLLTDIVLAVFVCQFNISNPLTPPSGWTLVQDGQQSGGIELIVYWANGNASFGAWGVSTNVPGTIVGFTIGYSGVDNTHPIDAAASAREDGFSTIATAPSVTTISANAMLVGFFGWWNGAASNLPVWSAEFGTHRQSGGHIDGAVIDSASIDAADALQAIAGASGDKTATVSIGSNVAGILVPLRPAASPNRGRFFHMF